MFAEKNFFIAGLGKKLRFHTEICVFREKQILKIDLFHRVKKLFNSNQTEHGVYHENLKCKTKKNFGIAGLGKKLRFHTEICVFREKQILKMDLFHRVKKLFKSNQTWYGVSPV